MATRSTVPGEVERGDTLIESREPMIISGFRYVDLHIIIGCPGKYRGKV